MLVRIREGFSLLDIKRYVDSRGYRGIGYGRLRFADLVEKAPLLVPVKNPDGQSRLVVFLGVIKDKVLLVDPLLGNTTMPRDEFERVWLGFPDFGRIGFVVAPGDGTTPPNQPGPTASAFIIDVNGDAELLLTNADGKKIGSIEGKYIDQIADAERFDYPEDYRWYLPLPTVPAAGSDRASTKSARRYYFSQDTELTAEISGTADGTYEFLKTKADGIVLFRYVPTAEGGPGLQSSFPVLSVAVAPFKDIITVSDSGDLSIRFDSGSSRNGKYYLFIKNDDLLQNATGDGGTQFESSSTSASVVRHRRK